MPKTLAVMLVDLERTPLGTRSRLAEELGGVPVLQRTAERVLAARRLDGGLAALAPRAQAEAVRGLLAGTAAQVVPHEAPAAPWAKLVRVARKWSLDGWRGGLGGTTSLDEYLHPALIDGLLKHMPADRIMAFPPAAAALDPALIDRMIDHHDAVDDDARMTFTQAPPGVAGAIFDASLIREMAEKNVPPGWILSYKPDAPRKDLAFFSCCCQIPAALSHAAGRLIADTDRSLARVAALLSDHPDADGETLGRWLAEHERTAVPPLPHEVEIELTTDDPFPNARLRPRGQRVGRRGPIPLETVEQAAEELARFDDARVVLGGFGEPLRHPRFAEVLAALRRCGVYAVAVRTSGVDLSDAAVDALIEHGADVLNVLIDGWSDETYAAMMAPGDLAPASRDGVLERIGRLERVRIERQSPAPVVVPEMVKARPTVHELAAFFDGWIRQLGAVSVTGYSHYGGQVEDLSVMSMAPPVRTACRRIRSRCLILADGRVTVCDQDFRGVQVLGRLGRLTPDGRSQPRVTLGELWTGPAMQRIREAHAAGRFDQAMPLCAGCEEWHRP